MSTLIKSISLKGTAELDVSRFKDGLSQVKSLRRQFENNPLKIPVQLDLRDIRSQAAKVAAEIKKTVGAALGSVGPMAGGSVSKGGIILPPGATMQLEKFRAAAGKEFKRIESDINNGKGRIIQSFEQLGQGIERVTTTNLSKKGKSVTVKTIDTRPVNDLKQALDQLERDYGSRIGAAKSGRGDMAAVLTEQRDKLQKALSQFGALEGSSEYRKANKMLDSLDRRISEAGASKSAKQERDFRSVSGSLDKQRNRELDKQTREQRAGEIRNLRNNLANINTASEPRLGAAQGSGDKIAVVRELQDRRSKIEAELNRFNRLQDTPAWRAAHKTWSSLDRQIESGTGAAARQKTTQDNTSERKSAQRAITREDRALQTALKRNKADEAAARAIRDQLTRETELNRVLNQRETLLANQAARYRQLSTRQRTAGREDAANKFEDAGMRTGNDLNQARLDRFRDRQQSSAKASDMALERSINRKMADYRLEKINLDAQEKIAKKIKDRSARESELNDILTRRRTLQTDTGRSLTGMQGVASSRGLTTIAAKAEGGVDTVRRDFVKDQNRFATATRNSGHALDFHTSSLLKNALTFTKWYLPAQAAMGVISAFTRGLGNAVAAQRTFKVLEAVFQGTEEDAKKLANQTLLLASANGRSADEAAQSAVAWARLGLTRTQVLMALETSLRAANVAEISSAEATAYLTATYKAFGLTISDLPSKLDYLNALSNRYNVTNKDLFEGISRTASVAKQAGLEFEDLAGIITVVTAATGRPGQEIGNALKFILNRARTPEVMKNLQKEFDIDITGPSGDVKKFSDILADLAAIYPGLSRLEKARLNDIVSGARQGNRFAIVMENWTDSLIAQAKAGLDANSAMRENQKVLGSVDAQIQAVSTSWTAMLHAMGEAGVFDTVAQGLHSIAEGFRDIATAKDESGADGGFKIEDRNIRSATAALLGDRRLFTVSKGTRTEEEIREAIATLKKIRDASEGPDAGNFTGAPITGDDGRYKGSVYENGRRFTEPGGDGIRLEAGESWNDVIRAFEEMLANATGKAAKESTAASAKDILDSQKRVGSMNAAQQAFEAMARDITASGSDPAKTLRQFDDAVGLLEALPGGAQNVARARLEVRPLLEAGRSEEASAALGGIAGRFRDQGNTEFATVETARQKAITTTGAAVIQTRDRLTELNQELAKTPEGSAQAILQKSIATTTDLLKEQEETLRTLTRNFEKPVTDPLDGLRDGRLSDYFRDIKEASEVMGGVLEGFANTGFGDLDAKLKIGAANLQGNLIQDALVLSQDQNGGRMDVLRRAIDGATRYGDGPYGRAPEDQKNLDSLRDELALHEAIDAKLTDELDKTREASAEILRKLEIERQAAALRESYDDGAASAAARAQSYAIGQSEGERMVNQTRGVFGAVNGMGVAGSIQDPRLGQGDSNQDARELGTITNNLALAKQGLLSMEDRMNRALAERVNLEGTITEEQRKQAQEASKRLQLASREDQLRAAGAAAILRSRGQSQFSAEEFQFFSQETRGALSGLMPDSVRGLDDNARGNAESRAKLDEEISLLARSLTTMREEFDNFRPHAENVAGDLIDPRAAITGANSGQRITDLNQNEVKVNLHLGEVSVNLDFARHVGEITTFMQQHFDVRFQQVAADLRASLGPFRDRTPSTGAANAVD